MPWHVSLDYDFYEEACEEFTWDIPADYNPVHDFLRKHDTPDTSPALYQVDSTGGSTTYTFGDIDRLTDKLANGFRDIGLDHGDRVGIVLPQKAATPMTHLACWKMGAISIPLSILFGEDALRYRLQNSGARIVVADSSIADTVESVRGDCPNLEHIVVVDDDQSDEYVDFDELLDRHTSDFDLFDATKDTESVIVYTSGSTGDPKGVVHTHSSWAGFCVGPSMFFELDLLNDPVLWTPADWAWFGGLTILTSAWHYGQPVVGCPMGGFDAERAFELISDYEVTHAWIPPTALRMMIQDVDDPAGQFDLSLDVIASGGEPLTPEILDWAADSFDNVVINEMYGQSEANMLSSNCQHWFPPKAGSMGKPCPGHDLAIIDSDTAEPVPTGEVGEIAIRRDGNPVLFERYWKLPEKTAAANQNGWHLTGDMARQDEEGYLWFKARTDDLIMTSGYRVGPGEVERAILEHPDVEQVGVVGESDDLRGEIIKAYVQPSGHRTSSEAFRTEIQEMVRTNLAKYKVPRAIEFHERLPTTATGKIRRNDLG